MANASLSQEALRNRVLGIVIVTVFLDMIGFGLVIPLMPFYVQKMHGTAQTVGWIVACFSGTQLLATPVLGRLADRVGRRKVILVSLVGNALSMLVFAFATRVLWLPLIFISRIAAGATAGNLSACQAAIADVTPPSERAKGMGLLGAGIGLGMVFGPILGSVTHRLGSTAPPIIAAAMAGIDVVFAYFLMPETKGIMAHTPTENAKPSKPSALSWTEAFQLVSSRKPLLIVLILGFLVFICLSNLTAVMSLFVNARLGWQEKEAGLVFGLFGVVTLIVQGLLIDKITKRFGTLNVLMFGLTLVCIGMASTAFSFSAATILLASTVVALGTAMTNPLLSAIASQYSDTNTHGTVLGLVQSSTGLARTIGPVWAGFLFKAVSQGAPFLAGAIAAAIAVSLAITLKQISKH